MRDEFAVFDNGNIGVRTFRNQIAAVEHRFLTIFFRCALARHNARNQVQRFNIAVEETRVFHRNQFVFLRKVFHRAGQAVNQQIGFALGERVVANPGAAGALPVNELVGVVDLFDAAVKRFGEFFAAVGAGISKSRQLL